MEKVNSTNVCGKTVTIYQDTEAALSVPVVYLMLYSGQGREVRDACRSLGCPPFTLAAVGDIDWDDEMTPWPHAPVFKGDDGYKGKASDFLERLITAVVPYAESVAVAVPAYSALAGYSLGGLFAAWSMFQKTPFTRFLSASGSLWYPGFLDYAAETGFIKPPDFVCLSLGDRESAAKNRILASVGECTQNFYTLLKEKNIPSAFEMNAGNHFADADLRTAKGIRTLLEHV